MSERFEIIQEEKMKIRATPMKAARILFERLLPQVKAEMDKQNALGVCDGFKLGGVLTASNGQSLRIEISVTPPLPTTPRNN